MQFLKNILIAGNTNFLSKIIIHFKKPGSSGSVRQELPAGKELKFFPKKAS